MINPFLSAEPPQAAETAPAGIGWNPVPVGADDLIAELFAIAGGEDEHRFVLDEEAFMAAIEDIPLFMRRAG
jgi:hypothetical protein